MFANGEVALDYGVVTKYHITKDGRNDTSLVEMGGAARLRNSLLNNLVVKTYSQHSV